MMDGGFSLSKTNIVVQSLNHAQLFYSLMDCSHEVSLSTGFSRQEYWSGLPFAPPGHLPDPGVKHMSPALAEGFFTTESPGKPG